MTIWHLYRFYWGNLQRFFNLLVDLLRNKDFLHSHRWSFRRWKFLCCGQHQFILFNRFSHNTINSTKVNLIETTKVINLLYFSSALPLQPMHRKTNVTVINSKLSHTKHNIDPIHRFTLTWQPKSVRNLWAFNCFDLKSAKIRRIQVFFFIIINDFIMYIRSKKYSITAKKQWFFEIKLAILSLNSFQVVRYYHILKAPKSIEESLTWPKCILFGVVKHFLGHLSDQHIFNRNFSMSFFF